MILLLKLCAIPFYPLGLALTLSIAGLLLVFSKKYFGKYLIAAGIVLLYVLSTPVVSRLIVKSLELPYLVSTEIPNGCSAIVLLGGGGMTLAPPLIYPEVNSAGDRILHAARLVKMGAAPIIIATGGFTVGAREDIISEAEENALLLREIGVDSSAIVLEKKARTTAEHAPLVAALLDSLKLPKKVVLVTSATHMRRASGVFRKAGYSVVTAATDFRGNGHLFENVKDIFPSAAALNDATDAVHEYYGIFGYKLLGKM